MADENAQGYDAFISYRRSDGRAVAQWLRRALQGYRAPRALRQRYGRRLEVYLDTSYERGTIDFYRDSIRPALLASRWLIVVATPDAVRRRAGAEDWIQREVDDFAAGPNGRNMVVVRGAGEFDGPLPAGIGERFANIEIVDLRGAGRLAFLNPIRAARLASEKLKLVAPLLAIPPAEMPRLRQEEEVRQQTRLGAATGATVGVVTAVAALSILAFEARNRAVRALEDSMHAAGSMALEASRLVDRNDHTGNIRKMIVNRGCDLVDKFRQGAASEPPIEELVMCRIERARERERIGETERAVAELDGAIAVAAAQDGQHGRVVAGLALLRARRAMAELELRRERLDDAARLFEATGREARRLADRHAGRSELLLAETEALGRLGDVEAKRKEPRTAATAYDRAAVAAEAFLAGRAGLTRSEDPAAIARLVRLHRLAGDQHGHLGDAAMAVERWRKAIAAGTSNEREKSPAVGYEVARARALIYALELGRRNTEAAELERAAALAGIERITAAAAASAAQKKQAGDLKAFIERQASR